jgi:fumarylacetoacetate (FAA) hydrolase
VVAGIYAQLNEPTDGMATPQLATLSFNEDACAAPLPRAYQWADGSAHVNHVELVRRARGAEMPAGFWSDPLSGRSSRRS